MLVIVLWILHLVNFPFGTVLGVYTFWALLTNDQHVLSACAAGNGGPERSAVT